MSPAQCLHASPYLGVFFITGGGSLLLSDLLTVPGASATVLEASVPYAETALADTLGGPPDQSCSPATAQALAMAAWQRAAELAPETPPEHLFGFGCTAALATDRPKRGAHRAFVAVQTLAQTHTASMEFDKPANDRAQEEHQVLELAYALLQQALATELNVPAQVRTTVTVARHEATPAWRKLLSGLSAAEVHAPANRTHLHSPTARVLFPGSFNPLHAGHLQMAEHASHVLDLPTEFELCIRNVDKPALSYAELSTRCAQFDQHRLWLTTLPTFVRKARQFPGATFVVGVDTLVRIGLARYYGSDQTMLEALREMAGLETRFLVFGRRMADRFESLASVALPATLRALCDGVDEDAFRHDISSSKLRDERQQR